MNKVNVNKVVDYANLLKENELLHSIIKEANEYIADRVVPDVNNYNIEFELKLNTTVDEFIRHLSEILDKVGSENNGS